MTSPEASRLIPLTEWNRHHPWPPQGGLRHLVFHEKTNGFKDAFVRVGKRVLIDEKRFFEIATQQNHEKGK